MGNTLNLDSSKATWDICFTYFKKTLTRTPVTQVLDNITGDETLTDGTPDASYPGILFRKETKWAQDNPGIIEDADAVLLVQDDQTLNRRDKITYDSEDFRVEKIVMRRLGEVDFYQVAQLYLL